MCVYGLFCLRCLVLYMCVHGVRMWFACFVKGDCICACVCGCVYACVLCVDVFGLCMLLND